MAGSDFDIVLKREARTSLQEFKNQSLLRRRFGEDAVKLYNLIDSGKPASELLSELGMPEGKFVEILEFMNNNAMVSVVSPAPGSSPPAGQDEAAGPAGGEEGGDGEVPEQEESQEPPPRGSPPGGKKFSTETLSPLEKILYEKYGELGVRIYSLIDGEKTAEEILKETGVSEAKLVEILEFMDEQGIIKLEKPASKEEPSEGGGDDGQAKEGEEGKGEDGAAREPRFKPMIEEAPEEKPFEPPKAPVKAAAPKEAEKKNEDEPEEDIIMVDVPAMAALSLMQKAVLITELSTKFGKGARALVDLVDGKRDFIGLSLSTGMSFFDIDAVMAYFGKKGFLTFSVLSRDEIKKRYGEDGFVIYKKYGRDGLLLYEMIGKEASLKDIISKSKVDADRAIEIFVFIHKVLGLDIPLDRDIIYRQLGLKK